MADSTPANRRMAPPPLNLSDYERAELRGALMFHFEDHECREELAAQLEVIDAVVERILNRRNFAAQAQRAVDGMTF